MNFNKQQTAQYAADICFQGSTLTYAINKTAFNDLDGELIQVKYRLIFQPIEISLETEGTSSFRALQDKIMAEQWQIVNCTESEDFIKITLPHLPYDVLCAVEVVGIDNHGLETKNPYVTPDFLAVYAPRTPILSLRLNKATITGSQKGQVSLCLNVEDWGFIKPYNWEAQDQNTTLSYLQTCFGAADATINYSQKVYDSKGQLIYEIGDIRRGSYSVEIFTPSFTYKINEVTSQYVKISAQNFQGTTLYWERGEGETESITLPQYYPPLQMYRNSVQITSPLTETSPEYKDSHLLVTSNDEQANVELKGKAELKFSDTSGKEKESIKLDAVTQGTTQLVFDGPIAISDGLGGHAVFHFVNGSLTISIIDAYGRRKDIPIAFGALGSQN